MLLLLVLLLVNLSLPAQAGPLKQRFSRYSGTKQNLYYDKEAFLEKAQREKEHFGKYIEYVIDYEMEDHKHRSKKQKFFHDDDGHFYKLSKELHGTRHVPTRKYTAFGVLF